MSAFNCLSPSIIRDSRGVIRRVACGHCAACCNRKGMKYTTACKLESSYHKYCMFITLTYNDDNLPVVSSFLDNDYYFFYNETGRDICKSVSPFFSVVPIRELGAHFLSTYAPKFNLRSELAHCVPVLSTYDLQKFIKRFRYYLNKYSNESIRYFAAGEYGPVHFRPHYHLLVWFDKESTLVHMGRCISKAWTCGRVDYSLSRGKTSSYVAKYVNSLTDLSRLHQIKAFRPFCLHSSHLGHSFYEDETKAVFNYDFKHYVEKSYSDNGRVKFVFPLSSFEDRFFPRSLSYSETTIGERLLCYNLYTRAVKEFGEQSCTILAHLIYQNDNSWCWQFLSRTYGASNVIEQTVLTCLYTSVKFLRNCETYNIIPWRMVNIIDKYYSDKEYYSLCEQLNSQAEFVRTYGVDYIHCLLWYYENFFLCKPGDVDRDGFLLYPKPVFDYIQSLGLNPVFITDTLCSLKQNPDFIDYCTRHRTLAESSVKHKKLNDLNKIFM